MATVQEKIEALAYMVCTAILCLVGVLFGSVLFATTNNILTGWNIQGAWGLGMLHAVQPNELIYYGVIFVFFIAMIVRTVFVVFSKTTYVETGYYL